MLSYSVVKREGLYCGDCHEELLMTGSRNEWPLGSQVGTEQSWAKMGDIFNTHTFILGNSAVQLWHLQTQNHCSPKFQSGQKL